MSKLSNYAIKIPSHEIYNIKLIEESLKRFKFVIISTGAAKWSEIKNIHKLIKKKRNKKMYAYYIVYLPIHVIMKMQTCQELIH